MAFPLRSASASPIPTPAGVPGQEPDADPYAVPLDPLQALKGTFSDFF